jgi:DNA-3-methyladenine glycosylase II
MRAGHDKQERNQAVALSHAKKEGAHQMVGRIIETPDCVAQGAQALATLEPRFAYALTLTGPLPLRRQPDGFSALLDAITGQQVSVASANAIWARMLAAGLTQRDAIIDASAQDLRDVGLSWQKARYAKALAMSGIDFDALRLLDDAQVIAQLVTVTGIGTWTAEIYAMFALGRADVFAPGDLALQEGARLLFDLEARPSERGLRAMSQAWSPWRSVAARILWAYYHVEKRREGIK